VRVSLIVVVSALALSATAAARETSAQGVHRHTASQALRAPPLAVFRRSSRDAPGYIFLASKGGSGQQGPEIVDDRGRPVWFDPIPSGEADDFRVQSYGGRPVLTWWQGTGFGGVAQGTDYIADSSYHVIATVHAGNGFDADGHEFLLTPQGTALITSYHQVPYDLTPVGGPRDGQAVDGVVQEIDVANGHVLFEWHSLDHVPLADSYQPVDSPYDYFHINSVSLDVDGNLLISGRHTWTIYKVDRHNGGIIWRLGGKRSDFNLAADARFAWQHDAVAAGGNLLQIFDNEGNDVGRVMPQSRVIWLHLDLGTMSASLAKSVTHPSGYAVPSQGNAQTLANGDTLVGWGELGRVSEFDAQNMLLFDGALTGGAQTYRAYRFTWSGQPNTRPRATARRSGRKRHRRTTVHAIWNGVTSVVRWRVLAGRSPKHLVTVRTVPWKGLDTEIAIARVPREVEVVALDGSGKVLGRSKPARVH
jgi:hypothetical protein